MCLWREYEGSGPILNGTAAHLGALGQALLQGSLAFILLSFHGALRLVRILLEVLVDGSLLQ